jgi:hypothetical protein
VPFVQAATTRGGIRWTAWGWNRSQVGGNTSDSFGKRVALGGDGRLYLLGEAHGGVTVFSRNAMSPGRGAPNVATDAYNTTYNTGSNALLYVARLDAATGRHLAGQLLLSRKKDGKGNSVAGQAIAADEAGRIVVAGASAAKVENRDAKTICGRRLPPYGGDVFVLQLSANLRARTLWTAIGGNGTAGGVAVRGGVAAAALTPTAPGALTCRALPGQARPARALSDRARDVHLTVWSAARP